MLNLARRLGAMHFSVSNVLPVTEDLQEERLYTKALRSLAYIPSSQVPRLSLPKMDFNELTQDALVQAFNSGFSVSYAGNSWGGANDVCNYIENGSMTIGWNGDVSPCWPLMHSHTSYLHGKVRHSQGHVVGNVRERGLLDLWLDPEYVGVSRAGAELRLPALHLLRRLRHVRVQRRGLLRQRIPRLRRLSVGAGCGTVSLKWLMVNG